MQLSFESLAVVVEAGSPQALLRDLCAPDGRHLPVPRRVWTGARVDVLLAVPPRGDRVRVPTLAHGATASPTGVVVGVPHPDAFAIAYVKALVGDAAVPEPAARASFIVDEAAAAELALFAAGAHARVPVPLLVHPGERVEIAAGAPAGDRVLVVGGRVEEVIRDGGGWVAHVIAYGPDDVAAAARFVGAHARLPSSKPFAGPRAQLLH